jgi:hypothetical protein
VAGSVNSVVGELRQPEALIGSERESLPLPGQVAIPIAVDEQDVIRGAVRLALVEDKPKGLVGPGAKRGQAVQGMLGDVGGLLAQGGPKLGQLGHLVATSLREAQQESRDRAGGQEAVHRSPPVPVGKT